MAEQEHPEGKDEKSEPERKDEPTVRQDPTGPRTPATFDDVCEEIGRQRLPMVVRLCQRRGIVTADELVDEGVPAYEAIVTLRYGVRIGVLGITMGYQLRAYQYDEDDEVADGPERPRRPPQTETETEYPSDADRHGRNSPYA